ncbi:MAG: tRNA (N6-threonylcarbamoyladenosine(37)-N6)-methyltransferase TrmO [Actinobacteria bacterium]|nr:tRNA (N6-threonylcarbamoyladenosine(37)-N6)-methyltransferase TrmO [Actinomycetota bacterium]
MIESYFLKQIGIVKSEIKDSKEMPIYGVSAQVIVYPEYQDGLDGIDENSHLIIFGWLHQADREKLKVVPRKINPNADEKGVFSLRSPVRPNPIAICSAQLIKRENNVLYLDRIDFIDGTPIVDIKPYSTGLDSIFSAKRPTEINPSSPPFNKGGMGGFLGENLPRTEIFQNMLFEAAHFHGEICVGLAIGVRVCYVAMKHLNTSLRDKKLKIVCYTKACVADAVQSLCGASNKRFTHLEPEDRVEFTKDDQKLIIKITSKKLNSVEEVFKLPYEEVFESVINPPLDKGR